MLFLVFLQIFLSIPAIVTVWFFFVLNYLKRKKRLPIQQNKKPFFFTKLLNITEKKNLKTFIIEPKG